jgi:hypothetical protein
MYDRPSHVHAASCGQAAGVSGKAQPADPRQHCLTLTRDDCVAIGLPIALRRDGRQSALAPQS